MPKEQAITEIVVHSMTKEMIQGYAWTHQRYEIVKSFLEIFNKTFQKYFSIVKPNFKYHELKVSLDKDGLIIISMVLKRRMLMNEKNTGNKYMEDKRLLDDYLDVFRKWSNIPCLVQCTDSNSGRGFSEYLLPTNCYEMLAEEDIPKGNRERFHNPAVKILTLPSRMMCALTMVEHEQGKKDFFRNATFIDRQKYLNDEKEWFKTLEEGFGKDVVSSMQKIRERIEDIGA